MDLIALFVATALLAGEPAEEHWAVYDSLVGAVASESPSVECSP